MSNHELARQYFLKLKLLGLEGMISVKLLPDDKVMLISINDTESTGSFTLPSFISEILRVHTLDNRWVPKLAFEKCNFSEIYIDNPPDIPFDATRLFLGLDSEKLKVRFKHPETIISTRMMFMSCYNLKTLDISGLNMPNNISMAKMFSECFKLESIVLDGIDTYNVKDMQEMFNGCYSLTSIDARKLNMSNVRSAQYMFSGCSSLKEIDLRGLDTSNVTTASGMFDKCFSLRSVDLTGHKFNKLVSANHMFNECRELVELKTDGLEIPKSANTKSIFRNCRKLSFESIVGFWGEDKHMEV